MQKRARGEAPTGKEPGEASRAPAGSSPFLVVGVALAAGAVLARWIDWRGHAHPRW